VEVIIECDNRERKIKPFMYGSVQFTGATRQVILVPDKAVLQDEDDRYVVVSEGGNKFRKAVVMAIPADQSLNSLKSSEDSMTVILAGISAEEQIVTDGAFYFIDAR
jgi:cobalt-zinc-cadmium efflux system membrane fusion protein